MDTTIISVRVRVLPNNEEVDVDLPINTTAAGVIENLLEAGIGQRHDNAGNPITYQLIPKGKNITIEEEETLQEAEVQEGDTLLMAPVFVAG